MPSAYPGALDTFATNKADNTNTATDHAAHHNDLAGAINKVEADLHPDRAAFIRERLWMPSGAVTWNFTRDRWTTATTLATAATWYFIGGGVLPAGRTVSNVTVWGAAAGATWTIRHFSLTDMNRVVLTRTANSTTALTLNAMNTFAFQASYTPSVDTPVYLVMGSASGTAGGLAGTAGMANAAMAGVAPLIMYSTTTNPPQTTPPGVGTTIGAASGTNIASIFGYYLT